MKKIISLIIVALMLISVNGIRTAFINKIPTFEDNSLDNVQEDKTVVDKVASSNEQEEVISSNETNKSEQKISSESIKIEETSEKVDENNNQVNENTSQTLKENNVQINDVEPQNENVNRETPWDSLGITEYEYYNSPAHSWAELDFKISDYGNRDATLKACQDYGNKYIAENSGGYWCNSINSYSGDYLGEDIDFF